MTELSKSITQKQFYYFRNKCRETVKDKNFPFNNFSLIKMVENRNNGTYTLVISQKRVYNELPRLADRVSYSYVYFRCI